MVHVGSRLRVRGRTFVVRVKLRREFADCAGGYDDGRGSRGFRRTWAASATHNFVYGECSSEYVLSNRPVGSYCIHAMGIESVHQTLVSYATSVSSSSSLSRFLAGLRRTSCISFLVPQRDSRISFTSAQS